uniref:Wd repeat-containing protein 65-like n=2 Tax=Tetraselmis sp. GSL018 TaxID=582737 RepID=A0A061RT72_9CHLO|eukprot:CAMPEP_0177612500 /NCGR_PEP_ID=MMETSP0419_2-20121207/21266_1 /TAXON_ID=582737 /ORGANISM="Tetraselmis sp., Strain GSL018" /LENGTH=1233 /DNA_ID=CAMNT_0019108717 /DNA_START=76 /DNA_END=3777 /DNA_ORIENTATION=-
MSALSALVPRHVFGFRGDVHSNVHYVDEHTVAYPAGHQTVLFNTETKGQKFVPGTVDSEGITVIAVSPNSKYLAVAEQSEKAMITVYDLQTLKRRKVLMSTDAGSKEYVSLSFSPDSKLLVAQGGAPEWNLVLWIWEKSKVASSFKTTNPTNSPVYQCLFNPADLGLVSVVGHGIFKVFKTTDSNLKLLPNALSKRDAQNYTCHAWMPEGSGEKERVVVGTDTGELLVVEGGELRSVLPSESGHSVESVAATTKGFVTGHEGGLVSIWEKIEGEERPYRRTKTFHIEGNSVKVKNMAVSASEEALLCSLENNQIFSLALSNTEIMKPDEMNFSHLAQDFHVESVTGVDTCVRKPIVATCSSDHSVRLWNHSERGAELIRQFPEEAFSVAMHPSGLSLLVGHGDKLRLMTVLLDDMRMVKEFPIKSCRECKFNHGGSMFAAVNGNTVQIYNTYTCENVGNLRGHNGKVRSVAWSADDRFIVSAGLDGAVYEWDVLSFKRVRENVLKGCNYSCVTCSADQRQVFACGSDKKLKEIEEGQVTKELDTDVLLTALVLPASGRTLFAATETGSVRCYKFPLTGEHQEYKCHNASITRLRMSFDDSLLYSASEDGCLFVFDIKDTDPAKLTRKDTERLPWAEEVLVTKGDMEEKKQRMQELEQQVNELTMQNEYQLRLKDLNHNEKLKEINDKFTAELESEKQKFELLLQEKNEQEMEYEEKLRVAEERHHAQMAALDSQYQQKIMSEVERYQSLMQEKELLHERWDEQNSLLVESHERVIQELTEEYEAKLQEEQMNLEMLGQEKEEQEREFEEIKRQLEEDADREIEELKERYESKLNGEREVGLRLKGENGIMKKRYNALQKDIDDQKEEIKQLFEQKKELYQTIASLEKDINGLKKEISERDETIGEKEKRIYDLKKKNQELEKFKFVLDYKIKELKKQIEPRELEIAEMKEQIKEMDHELERYHKNNANLDLTIADYKMKTNGLQAEALKQRTAYGQSVSVIKRFQHDLHETAQYIQDPKMLKDKVKELYAKHVMENTKSGDIEEDIQWEYNRQREYLEKTVDNLKRKLAKDMDLHRTDNMRVMQENVALIKEINELRREIKNLKSGACKDGKDAFKRGLSKSGDFEFAARDKEIEMQRDLIQRLRNELLHCNQRIKELEEHVNKRPVSRERLPPMEGMEPNIPKPPSRDSQRGSSREDKPLSTAVAASQPDHFPPPSPGDVGMVESKIIADDG